MKVIKPGRDISDWKLIVVHSYCKAELEIQAKDLVFKSDNDPRGSSSWFEYKCGFCGRQGSVSYDSVDEFVRRTIIYG